MTIIDPLQLDTDDYWCSLTYYHKLQTVSDVYWPINSNYSLWIIHFNWWLMFTETLPLITEDYWHFLTHYDSLLTNTEDYLPIPTQYRCLLTHYWRILTLYHSLLTIIYVYAYYHSLQTITDLLPLSTVNYSRPPPHPHPLISTHYRHIATHYWWSLCLLAHYHTLLTFIYPLALNIDDYWRVITNHY